MNPSPDPQAAYQPRDELYLWWLAHPSQPRLIGDLSLVMGNRSVGLRYADEWLRSGFALSQDLALRRGLFVQVAWVAYQSTCIVWPMNSLEIEP